VFEHERRLAGASGEQRDWIRMNRDDKLGFIEGRLRTYCIDMQMQYSKSPSILNSQIVLNVFTSGSHYTVKYDISA
jgi:hypothetical protein